MVTGSLAKSATVRPGRNVLLEVQTLLTIDDVDGLANMVNFMLPILLDQTPQDEPLVR